MLKILKEVFLTKQMEVDNSGKKVQVHSHTPEDQGLFLQKVFAFVNPTTTLEVGLAYGISTLFILEMHNKRKNSENCKHIAIDPDCYWGNAALHNIEKEGLSRFLKLYKCYSDEILPRLYYEGQRVQYAYIDTTKRFDIVFQDYYFINKMLDVGGVIIFDDTGGSCPGIQRVVRYISSLPYYELLDSHGQIKYSTKKSFVAKVVSLILSIIPFLKKLYPTFNFKNDKEMGLNYKCIVFRKTSEDNLGWSWDAGF